MEWKSSRISILYFYERLFYDSSAIKEIFYEKQVVEKNLE